ncbi:hypothetical protein BDV96DRAFT_28851 [Lophiotrema nucula]|uniref:Uncharacterized protein n=1 Tax=Lophiotrema nucula TaxID=690887 RepID=A0A6A5ZDQ8_9PLEO|nr:hypothetical protein BDV96DRAFT_28851 [Lophiotrema nucula]
MGGAEMVTGGTGGSNETQKRSDLQRRLSRRHELTISKKLRVSAFDAVPSSMRPPTAKGLSFEILAKMSDLAVEVPDVGSFKKALEDARRRRMPGPMIRSYLAVEDVDMALRLLLGEDAKVELLPSPPTKPKQRRRGTVRPSFEAVDFHEETLKERPSKTRAYLNIAGYVKELKPTRRPSGGLRAPQAIPSGRVKGGRGSSKLKRDIDHDVGGLLSLEQRSIEQEVVKTPDKGQVLPSERSKRKSEPESLTATPRRPLTGVKRSRRTHVKRPVVHSSSSEERSTSDPIDADVDADEDDIDVDGSSSPPCLTSRGGSTAMRRSERNQKGVSDGQRQSLQTEHGFFFRMPHDQHYKTLNPRILENPLDITTFEGLQYPVEVRNPDSKGEFYEMHNEDDLREHIEWLKAREEPSPNYNNEDSQPLLTGSHPTIHPLKARLEDNVQTLLDSMLFVYADAKREAQRTQDVSSTDTKSDQLQLLSDQFNRTVKAAKQDYEDGLKALWVLPLTAIDAEQEKEGYVHSLLGLVSSPESETGLLQYDGANDMEKDYSMNVEEQIASESERSLQAQETVPSDASFVGWGS